MLKEFIPVLLQILIATGFAVATLIASALLGKRAKRNQMKDSAYECGMLPVGDGQARFSVKFYLVAMLFVLFDIEVVFLYPGAVIFRDQIAAYGVGIAWAALGFISAIRRASIMWWVSAPAGQWSERISASSTSSSSVSKISRVRSGA